jgi:ElaB/YqjD/DUF883 family membrane-anchored ribosome-binding protein
MSGEPDSGILTFEHDLALQPYPGLADGAWTPHGPSCVSRIWAGQRTEVEMNWNSRTSAYGDDAADRIQSLADDAKSTAARMQSRVSDAWGKGADWASKKSDDLDATSRQLIGSMSDAVSTRPLLAVGIAILAGVVISRLLSRD